MPARYSLVLLLLLWQITLFAQDQYIDSLKNVLTRNISDSTRVKAMNELSNALRRTHPQKARQYALNALELANRSDNNEGFADAAVTLGDLAREQGNNAAEQYYTHATDIYLEDSLHLKAAKTLNKAGIYYMMNGMYPQARDKYRQSLTIFMRLKDMESAAGMLSNLGSVAYLEGNHNLALDYFAKALKIRNTLGDKAGSAGLLINTGNIYNLQGKYQLALQNYQRALQIKVELDDSRGIATCLNNIGTVYFYQDENKLAKDYYLKALQLSDSIGHRTGMSESLVNLGQVHGEEGNLTKSLEYYFKALPLLENGGNPQILSTLYMGLGKTNAQLGNHPQAIRYLKKALITAEEIDAGTEIKNAHFELSAAYENAGNLAKALEHYKKYTAEKEDEFSEETAAKTAELEFKFRQSDTEKELNLLRKENEVQSLRLTNNRFIIIATLTGSFLIILFLMGLLYNYQKNKKKNLLLSEQNRDILIQKEEKEVLLKEIHHRVKNNLQIISSLLRLQSRYINDKEVLSYFEESQDRIYAMALIHEKLYESEDLSRISIRDYLNNLIDNLIRSYALEIPIQKEVHVGEVKFGVSLLIPVGLILNETLSNSMKHAFKNMPAGVVSVDIKPAGDDIVMIISDDGPGFPAELLETSPTLGLELIKTFTEQLEGSIEYSNVAGSRFVIRFPASYR